MAARSRSSKPLSAAISARMAPIASERAAFFVVLTKERSATVWITPPFSPTARSCSSSRLRLTSLSARAAEWDATTGARVSSSVCMIDGLDGCEMSIMMPSRFISAIASRPSR